MYVDESGDPGLVGSPTSFFILSGLVVHETKWQASLDRLVDFRKGLRDSFRLLLREEIHSSHFINRPGDLVRIPRNQRLSILRFFARELSGIQDLRLVSVVVDKRTKAAEYGVFENAWQALLQRFENTMAHRNFAGPAVADERGIVFPDDTDRKKLTTLLRKMRHYNPIPNQGQHGPGYRNLQLRRIVEDPVFKRSDHSYFIQACDLCAFLLYQELNPNTYMKKKGGHKYFRSLSPIFCTQASPPDGIVRL
jgi:uncharacterized protein DUF3800